MEFFNSLSQPRRKRSQASQLPLNAPGGSATTGNSNSNSNSNSGGTPPPMPTGPPTSAPADGQASNSNNGSAQPTHSLLHRASTGFLNQLTSPFNNSNNNNSNNGAVSQSSSGGSGDRSPYRRDLSDPYQHGSSGGSHNYYGGSGANAGSRRSSPYTAGDGQRPPTVAEHQDDAMLQQTSPPLPSLSSLSGDASAAGHADESDDAIDAAPGAHRRHLMSLTHASSPGSGSLSVRIRSTSSHHSLNSVYSAHSYLSSNPESASIVSETGSTSGPATSLMHHAAQPTITLGAGNVQPSMSITSMHSSGSRNGAMASPPASPTTIDGHMQAGNLPSMPPMSSSSSFSSNSMGQRRPSNTMLAMPSGNSGTNISLSNSARSETSGAVSDKVLLKKVKVFLDDRQKLKARFQSLVNFIDAANNLDQAIFFQDHADNVFMVVVDTCEGHIRKIKQRNVKPTSLASKDIQMLLRSLTVFRRILLYLPDRLRTGWRSDEIGRILAPLLDHGNHMRIRMIGLRLLLLWMRSAPDCETSAANDIRCLFAYAIPLGVFLRETVGLQYVPTRHTSRLGSVRLPPAPPDEVSDVELLLPSTHKPTGSDALLLFGAIFDEMVVLAHLSTNNPAPDSDDDELAQMSSGEATLFCAGIGSAQHALRYISQQLAEAYLVKLMPGAVFHNTEHRLPELGFVRCPPSFLRLFIGFMLDSTMPPNFGSSNRREQALDASVTLMMHKVTSNLRQFRVFRAECVEQALTLRPASAYQDLFRSALYIATHWMTRAEEDWPLDLRAIKAEGGVASLIEEFKLSEADQNSPAVTYFVWNQQFCWYTDVLLLPLETIPEDEDDARIPLRLHRLILSLVRVVLAANNERLLPSTWNHTLRALLAIQSLVMAGKPRYSSKTIDSLIGMLVKTIYVTWARANTNDHEIWEQLCTAMQRHILWPQVVRQWGKMVLKMTRVIIKEVYGIDTKKLGQDVMLPKLLRKKKNALQRRVSLVSGSIPKDIKGQFSGSGSSSAAAAAAAAASRSLRKHHSTNPMALMSGGHRHDDSFGGTMSAASHSHHQHTTGMSDEESPRIERKRSQTHNALDRLVNVTRSTSETATTHHPKFHYERLQAALEVTFADFKTEGFTELSSVKWTPDYALRSWKNILCSLGNPNSIENPGFHLEAIDCLVDTWSMLAAVQRRQSIGGGYQPALIEFMPWLFQAADMPVAYAASRAAAYGCICRMMGTKLDEPGVAIKDDRIRTSIMWRSANLFRNCLPGSTVLLPSYLMCFRTMLLEDGKTKMRQIPKEIRIATAKTLCSMICLPNRFTSLRVPIVTYNQLLKRLQSDYKESPIEPISCPSIRAHFITLLSDLLTAASSQPVAQYDGELHSILVYTMLVILLDDLATETPNTNMIRRCLATLLSHLYLKSTEPAIAAITGLSVFLHDPVRLAALGDIITDIVGALGEQLKSRPRDKTRSQCDLMAMMLDALVEWVMVDSVSEHVLRHLSPVIFDTLDLATQELSSNHTGFTSNSNGGSGTNPSTPSTVEPALHFGDLNRPVRRSSIQLLRGRRSHSGGAGSVGSTEQFDTEVAHTHAPTQVTFSHATGATTVVSNPTATTNTASGSGQSHQTPQTQQQQAHQHASHATAATPTTSTSPATAGTHASPSIPAHDGWSIVQESAEAALLHMLHHFNGFPPRHGADMLHSMLKESSNHESSEESYDNSLLLMYNGNTIISFCMDSSHPYVIRVILRNPTGKYVWDMQSIESLHEMDTKSEASQSTSSLGSTGSTAAAAITPSDSVILDRKCLTRAACTTSEATKAMTCCVNDLDSSNIPADPLAELLDRIESTTGYDSPIDREMPLSPDGIKEPTNPCGPAASRCCGGGGGGGSTDPSPPALPARPPLDTRTSTHTIHPPAEVPLPPLPGAGQEALLERVMVDNMQCRVLMSQLGLLDEEAVEGDKICQLKITPSLIRDVKELDRKYGREVIKIGLLYVAPGQDTERAILGNDSASIMYDQFVATLGWEIDLRSHGGYRGRLDSEENYHTAIYYANSTIEMLFHDATRLPTNPNDPQQVKKKRHIGNDHVHIVWNEHRRDYRPDTIGGDFGNIQIVITPVPNGLFAIDIFRDQRLDLPGPLVDGMMVPCAMQRLKDLKVIFNRHRESQT
ncbi:hypothetical protein SYNPS1DRAFT_26584 [Syncephalis pseudoplumigaleata]|uniref:Rap-GAP domain-containing protein n=1 Tax=Syncephalis pseudoplumigaleata TaxID=1712513 RepID=A0A4P9Z590_9FUNG|nr:hypothetical protein SYNPS1DRAFT_26584 [Syncephalis pseudoplumigaleata]|eukprot:RKP27777.1 hypothetical protein SYNPS1DRAFT_26584 [Syncephalis pseudoplumigaleata]